MGLTVQEIARKWQRNLSASGESIKAGVQAVTVAPTEKAAENVDRYLAGVQRAVSDGKYQAGLRRVSLEDWKRSMLDKGIPRISAGATAAMPKVEAFLAEFLPYVQQGQQRLEQMPRGTLEENIARAVFMMNHNSQFRRRN